LNYLSRKVQGFVIALCCHQICNFGSYINRKYLEKLGITAEEFGFLCYISTWAICGESPEIQVQPHWSGLDYSTREELGFKCKRILDFGRVHYLRSLGANCELKYYVPRSTSKENVALVGTWDL
jgi:tRNA:m4X modification enzyme